MVCFSTSIRPHLFSETKCQSISASLQKTTLHGDCITGGLGQHTRPSTANRLLLVFCTQKTTTYYSRGVTCYGGSGVTWSTGPSSSNLIVFKYQRLSQFWCSSSVLEPVFFTIYCSHCKAHTTTRTSLHRLDLLLPAPLISQQSTERNAIRWRHTASSCCACWLHICRPVNACCVHFRHHTVIYTKWSVTKSRL